MSKSKINYLDPKYKFNPDKIYFLQFWDVDGNERVYIAKPTKQSGHFKTLEVIKDASDVPWTCSFVWTGFKTNDIILELKDAEDGYTPGEFQEKYPEYLI